MTTEEREALKALTDAIEALPAPHRKAVRDKLIAYLDAKFVAQVKRCDDDTVYGRML